MLHFELFPLLPESSVNARVAELTGVAVDGSGAVDFSQSPLHFRKFDAHARGFLVRQGSDSTLVNLSG